MKAFLFALAFFGLAVVATGVVFRSGLSYSVTEAYSLESARPSESAVENRLGWTPDT